MRITYPYRTYPRTQPVWSIGRTERDRLARPRWRRVLVGHSDTSAPTPPQVACNSIEQTFNKPRKRWNSIATNSWFEIVAGELHAKMMGGGRTRPRCPWAAAAGPGRTTRRRAERSSRRGRLTGGPPPMGTPSSPARRRSEHQRSKTQPRHNKAARPHRGRAA